MLNRPVKGIGEPETLSYFYAPFVENLLKTYNLHGGSWAVSCEVLGIPFMHYIASPKNSTGTSSQKSIYGFRCARDARGSIAATPISDKEEASETCPLCGGEFIEFNLKDIKVPESNIYSWFGYFDIE